MENFTILKSLYSGYNLDLKIANFQVFPIWEIDYFILSKNSYLYTENPIAE